MLEKFVEELDEELLVECFEEFLEEFLIDFLQKPSEEPWIKFLRNIYENVLKITGKST